MTNRLMCWTWESIRQQKTKQWHDAARRQRNVLRRRKQFAKIILVCILYQQKLSVCHQKKSAHLQQKQWVQTVKPCLLQFQTPQQMAHQTGTMRRKKKMERNYRRGGTVGACWRRMQNKCACTFHTVWLLQSCSFSHDTCSLAALSKVLLRWLTEGCQAFNVSHIWALRFAAGRGMLSIEANFLIMSNMILLETASVDSREKATALNPVTFPQC